MVLNFLILYYIAFELNSVLPSPSSGGRFSGPPWPCSGGGPFFSCGIRLLCSQDTEFICDIELTQFINDLHKICCNILNRRLEGYFCLIDANNLIVMFLPLFMADSEESCNFIKSFVFSFWYFSIRKTPKESEKHTEGKKSIIF